MAVRRRTALAFCKVGGAPLFAVALALLPLGADAQDGGGDDSTPPPVTISRVTSVTPSPSSCNERSTDGCYCVDSEKVKDWRAKALAYEALVSSPPIVCVEGDDTSTRTLWSSVTAIMAVLAAWASSKL